MERTMRMKVAGLGWLGLSFWLLVASGGCSDGGSARLGDDVVVQSEALGSTSSAGLQLQVLTNSCGANQMQDFFQVTNTGTTSIALSDISIKFWADDTSGSALVPAVNTGGCVTGVGGNPSCVHPVTGVTAAASPFSPACGPDADHQASSEITVSTSDHALLGPGQIWTNIQTAMHLANWTNFTPGTSKWFSPCLSGFHYASDVHFAVYFQGDLVLSSSGFSAPSCRSPHGQQQLSGYLPTNMSSRPIVGPVPGSTTIHLAAGLPARDTAGLMAFAHQVSDPSSATFRHYLTPAQFASTYGATQYDYTALTSWATSNGLTVNASYGNRLVLDVTGTAATLEKALFTNLVFRQRPDGTQFFSVDREPSLDLATTVLRISGLDNLVKPVPAAGSGPKGTYSGADFRNAYTSSPCVMPFGNGQSIGVYEVDGYHASDISAYFRVADMVPVPVNNVFVNDFSGVPSDGNNTLEAATDIEVAAAMAPGASEIVVFEGVATNSILSSMATRTPLVRQISSSFPEEHADAETRLLLAEFATQGQSFFLASGDKGSYQNDPGDLRDEPFITVVGGTALTTDGATRTSETTWKEPDPTHPGQIAASGGGRLNAAAPDYQLGVPGANLTNRSLPDVSMVATNVLVIGPFTDTMTGAVTQGAAISTLGTSISAPLWAGFMALVNQQSQANGLGTVGFANPVLYAIARSPLYHTMFNDINDRSDNVGFTADDGYDLATGLGTPQCALIGQLASSSPNPTTQVAGGAFFTCVLRPGNAGSVISCFGANDVGQLGDGTTTDRSLPAPIVGVTGATAIVVGDFHSCALMPDGTAFCWGGNSAGQLGNGQKIDVSHGEPAPVQVSGLTGAKQLAAGHAHTCALMQDNTVQCWGSNAGGQLGDDSTEHLTPAPVPGLTDVQSIVAGFAHTCALAGGFIKCWGTNIFGQLGDGTKTSRHTPGFVKQNGAILSGIGAIASGDEFSCALNGNGAGGLVFCWGRNDTGVLGDGTTIDQPSPVEVQNLSGVVSIAAGGEHACALLQNGTLKCWGDNAEGDLGVGTFTIPVPNLPQMVHNLSGVTQVSASSDHTCALGPNGSVSCWGDDQLGELGDGNTNINRLEPVTVHFF